MDPKECDYNAKNLLPFITNFPGTPESTTDIII